MIFMDDFWKKFKNYFIAGLIAILPLWITYFILLAVFKVATSLAKPFLRYIGPIASVPWLLNILSLVVTTLIVVALGVLLTNMFGRRLFFKIEAYIQRIPLLSWIYSSTRKLTTVFYSEEPANHLKRVVLIEYPRRGSYVIGFMTSEAIAPIKNKKNLDLVNVFLPTTPNPTSGYLLLLPRKDVTPLDISTEQAVKLIVSGGMGSS